jgi:hypothetical protein
MDEVRQWYAHMFDAPIAELGLSRPMIALPDLGATTFDLGIDVVDIAGLADANIAHANTIPELELYYVFERRPDLLHAHKGWAYAFPHMQTLLNDYLPIDTPDGSFEAVRRDLFVERAVDGRLSLLAGDVALAGFSGPTAAEPGGVLLFDLYLAPVRQHPDPVHLELRVLRADGSIMRVQHVACGPSFYPPMGWASGERVRERVAVPAGDVPGVYTIQLLASAREEEAPHVAVSREVAIEAAAARQFAAGRLREAQLLAQAGRVNELSRELDVAAAAAPTSARWESQRAGYLSVSARAIALRASQCVDRREWMCALDTLRLADRIGAARTDSTELHALGARLLAYSSRERDTPAAYALSRGAWFANPQDPIAQRTLIEKRTAIFVQ